MRRPLLALLLLLTAALAACLGSSDEALEPGATGGAADVPTLPEGLEMEGAEVVSYNETSVTWRWVGVAPAGAGETETDLGPAATTIVDVPAGVAFQATANLTWEELHAFLGVRLLDGEGTSWCEDRRGVLTVTPDDGVEQPSPQASCDTRQGQIESPAPWTVAVESRANAPAVAFELLLTLAVQPSFDPPGCDPARAAVAHHANGRPIEAVSRPVPTPCFVRTGYGSGEPTMGITANGTLYVYPAAEVIGAGTAPVGVARSTDGGASWAQILPGEAGQPTHRGTLDPYMHVDPVTNRVYLDDLLPGGTCSILSWSDDDARSWDHSYAGCMETDHQNLFSGPPTISPNLGHESVLYRCAYNTVALVIASTSTTCQRSLDGGRTWLPPGEPAFATRPGGQGHFGLPFCDGGTAQGAVADDGTVFVPKGWCGQPWVAISEDEGLTWTRVQVANNGMRVDESGFASHEAGVAVDTTGNVYFLWVAEDRMPYLAVSVDGGQTWHEPINVAPPGLTQASRPALAAGGDGRIAFSYVGSTNAPEGPWETCENPTATSCLDPPRGYEQTTWNGYISMTVDALSDDPTFYTAPANAPDEPLVIGYCGSVGCQEIIDFIDVVIAPDGTPWAPYVDGCSSEMTTCEPEDGEVGEGVAGRLAGGPSLWDETDPNGPYPDEVGP